MGKKRPNTIAVRKVILVTGSRWADRTQNAKTIYESLDEQRGKLPSQAVFMVHGGASGADSIARQWSTKNARQIHFPYLSHLGRLGGPGRNQDMVFYCLGAMGFGVEVVCLAFPAENEPSKGTRNCMALAARAGIPVVEVPITVFRP